MQLLLLLGCEFYVMIRVDRRYGMDKHILIEIARNAIVEEFTGKKRIDRDALVCAHPWLAEKGAVFVTLNEYNQLRGCIGSIIAHEPLIDDLIRNAKAAAFSDPRFRPLESEELEQIEIEVSLLSEPESVAYRDTEALRRIIRPGIDGVILRQGGYQATYLPSVWEQIGDFDTFFASLCQKAGLSGDCLEQHPQIWRYQVT
jgi:AmmeMemoRadiSam system protein A